MLRLDHGCQQEYRICPVKSAVSSNRLTRREFLNQTTAGVAALQAGAHGVILSRTDSEIQLANLAAAGCAARDAKA